MSKPDLIPTEIGAMETFPGEDRVLVPRGLIGAACSAIANKREGTKVLAELRRYTVGDLSAAAYVHTPSASDLPAYPPLPETSVTGMGDEYEAFDRNGRAMGKAYEEIKYFNSAQMHAYVDADRAARACIPSTPSPLVGADGETTQGPA